MTLTTVVDSSSLSELKVAKAVELEAQHLGSFKLEVVDVTRQPLL